MANPSAHKSFASWEGSSWSALWTGKPLAAIEFDNRKHQAIELFGEHYSPELIQSGHEISRVHEFIHTIVRAALRDNWKSKSVQVSSTIIEESYRYNFDPIFLVAVIDHESGFDPSAEGLAGERGLMQLMPLTAKWVAKKYEIPWKGDKTRRDLVMNIRIGAAYLAHLRDRYHNQAQMYLQAYNMGASKLNQALREKRNPNQYTSHVLEKYLGFYRTLNEQKFKL